MKTITNIEFKQNKNKTYSSVYKIKVNAFKKVQCTIKSYDQNMIIKY